MSQYIRKYKGVMKCPKCGKYIEYEGQRDMRPFRSDQIDPPDSWFESEHNGECSDPEWVDNGSMDVWLMEQILEE